MTDYLTSHLDLNPLAIAAFALVGIILVVYSPVWAKRRRRARVLAERHARVAEDEAWAHRDEHADVARRLRWEQHSSATSSARGEFSGIAGGS